MFKKKKKKKFLYFKKKKKKNTNKINGVLKTLNMVPLAPLRRCTWFSHSCYVLQIS